MSDSETETKPLDHLAAAEDRIDPAPADPTPAQEPAPAVEAKPSEPLPAADRLRAFEDEYLGKDCVRISGRVERGSGSPYQRLSHELRRQHAALEHLIESEQRLADAHSALLQAEADHEAALAAAEPKPDATE